VQSGSISPQDTQDNESEEKAEKSQQGQAPVNVIVGNGRDPDKPIKKRAIVRRTGDGEYVMESIETSEDGEDGMTAKKTSNKKIRAK